MPAKRLPWIKFWPELLEHKKFGELTDAESWTWVVIWGKASQQPERWTFASIDHAARATGRARRQIKRLIDVHLIDEDRVGRLTIHDVKQWQERFPSDGPPEDHSRSYENSANTPSTVHENSLNGAAKLPERPLEHSDPSLLQKGEERRKTIETRDVTPAPSEHPQRVERSRASVIDEDFTAELEDQFWETFGSREAVRDSIANAMGYKKIGQYTDQRAYLRNWVRGDAEKAQLRRGNRVVPMNGRAAPRLGVRHA